MSSWFVPTRPSPSARGEDRHSGRRQRCRFCRARQPGDTVVVDGADRLRGWRRHRNSGAHPTAKIAAPSGGTQEEAVRAARRVQLQEAMNKACSADIQKHCEGAAGREALTRLFQNRDVLNADCSRALSQMRQHAGGGRRRGGGGGGGGGGRSSARLNPIAARTPPRRSFSVRSPPRCS